MNISLLNYGWFCVVFIFVFLCEQILPIAFFDQLMLLQKF